MKQHIKNFFLNLFLVLISLCVVLILLEIVFRLILPPPQIVDQSTLVSPAPKNKMLTVERYIDESFKEQKDNSVRMKKNLTLQIRNHRISGLNVEVRTNSLGFRHEDLPPKTDKDFRILVLGDSITLGEYLPQEQTYPSMIEHYLQASPPDDLRDKQITVINAGVNGIDLSNEYAILMDKGLKIRPDVVLVGLYLNDAIQSVSINHVHVPKLIEKSYLYQFLADKVNVFRKIHAAQQAEFKFHKKKRVLKAAQKKFAAENSVADRSDGYQTSAAAFNRFLLEGYEEYGFAWRPEYWTIIKQIARLFQKTGQEQGFQLVIVLFPMKLQLETTPLRNEPQQYFNALMREMDISHLDLLPFLLKEYQTTGTNYFYDTCHLTAQGTDIAGQAIADFLKTEISEVPEGKPINR